MEIFKAASTHFDNQLKTHQNETARVRPVEKTQIETNNAKESNKEVSKEQLDDAIKKLNEHMKELGTDIRFGYNDKINTMYVSVIATKTGQVIRKFPTDEAMKLSESMKEAIGIIFDKKS